MKDFVYLFNLFTYMELGYKININNINKLIKLININKIDFVIVLRFGYWENVKGTCHCTRFF